MSGRFEDWTQFPWVPLKVLYHRTNSCVIAKRKGRKKCGLMLMENRVWYRQTPPQDILKNLCHCHEGRKESMSLLHRCNQVMSHWIFPNCILFHKPGMPPGYLVFPTARNYLVTSQKKSLTSGGRPKTPRTTSWEQDKKYYALFPRIWTRS